MPIYLPPVSRRGFLKSTVAAGAAVVLGCQSSRRGTTAAAAGPDRYILLSDVHIAADPAHVARDVNMSDHLRQACAEAVKAAGDGVRPAAFMVNGDLAFNLGQPGDYANFLSLMEPVRKAEYPVYLSMGNHDGREAFWAAVPGGAINRASLPKPVEGRQVMVIEGAQADWVILDSLDKTNSTPGVLGAHQIGWLAKTLDARAGSKKPAIVMVHHHPQMPTVATRKSAATARVDFAGITDSKALLDVLVPRRQVKALVFGHTHLWHYGQVDGLHFVNLPAVAYVFQKEQPSAWTDCVVSEGGMKLKLHTLDKAHPWNGDAKDLKWRV